MKLITIQLRTKTKILTKYVVNPYFYDVILWMIFWNMKYLFYNFLLLLLCCACCKFAIQPFMQEDRQAIQTKLAKDWQTDCYPSLFYRELQKHYGIFPQSPTAIPTECYSSVFYQELQKNYGPCHIHRRIYRRIHRRMMHIPTRKTAWLVGTVTNGRGKSNVRMLWHTVTDRFADGRRKIWRDFQKFSANFKTIPMKIPTGFNATAKKNIILFSVGNSVGKPAV